MGNCRFCGGDLSLTFIDLKHSPVSNKLLSLEDLAKPEITFPLIVKVCQNCFLVQTEDYQTSSEIFTEDYPYFSSFSKSWLEHSKNYVSMMIDRFGYTSDSLVVEIASNDGYLLQYFKEAGVSVIGIEPTKSTAQVALSKGIDTVIDFFGKKLAIQRFNIKKADLILGNNVIAHVPDINDFIAGVKFALGEGGVCTFEFPHLLQLHQNNQFDTIYQEHFSYLSLFSVQKIFDKHGLKIFDVEEFSTHGGSIRIFCAHKDNEAQVISANVNRVLKDELNAGIDKPQFYEGFEKKALNIKIELLQFLLEKFKSNKSVAAYGAAAKGNTLLNYCGIKDDLICFCSDANIHKQDKYMPGSHIPILSPEEIKNRKPDYVLILPWNLRNEIKKDLHYISEWGGKFVVAIPQLEIFNP